MIDIHYFDKIKNVVTSTSVVAVVVVDAQLLKWWWLAGPTAAVEPAHAARA
jgi:hypothetical protein